MSFAPNFIESETNVYNARMEQLNKYVERRGDMYRKAEEAAYKGRTELFARYTAIAEEYQEMIEDLQFEIDRDWR